MPEFLSVLIFVSFALACGWVLLDAFLKPSDYTGFEKILYFPVYCLGRLLWRVEVKHDGNKFASLGGQGAVIVANHCNSLDPFFIQLAAGRRVHWMVAGEYFQNPVFGPALRAFQAIPTNRSGVDNVAMKTAIRLTSEGRLVGMFPEGRINRTHQPLVSIRTGAGLVASKSRCPLLPCWIEGAPIGWDVWSGLFTAAKITIYIGQPVRMEKEDLSNSEYNELITIAAMKSSLRLGKNDAWPVRLTGKRGLRR